MNRVARYTVGLFGIFDMFVFSFKNSFQDVSQWQFRVQVLKNKVSLLELQSFSILIYISMDSIRFYMEILQASIDNSRGISIFFRLPCMSLIDYANTCIDLFHLC